MLEAGADQKMNASATTAILPDGPANGHARTDDHARHATWWQPQDGHGDEMCTLLPSNHLAHAARAHGSAPMYQLHATTTTAAGVAKQPKRSHPDSIATFRALAGQAEVCSALWSRPTIWVPGGALLDQLDPAATGAPWRWLHGALRTIYFGA
jgi:hypothetical protein